MMLNLKIKSNKFSTAEKTMNKLIIALIAYLFVEILVCSVLHHTIDDYPVQVCRDIKVSLILILVKYS